jgi:hypothetical protein
MTDADQETLNLPNLLDKAKQVVVKKKPALRKTRRKGKKSIPFDKDPEILARLATVAEMMLVGAKAFQIAASMNCSIATAKRDIGRIRQLWKDDARDEVDSFRPAALALYRLIIMRAWEEYGKKDNANKRDRYLTLIIATQKHMDRINGVGPLQSDMTSQMEITEDIEKVRERRWKQVMPQLAEMIKEKV